MKLNGGKLNSKGEGNEIKEGEKLIKGGKI